VRLEDRDRALQERLRFGVTALDPIQLGEVIERDADRWMFRSQRLFRYRQAALEQRLGSGVTALALV